MIYDYIIIGAGISGAVCAYELSKSKKKCLILEKNFMQKEKVCGGGVSYKAIRLLQDIGIDKRLLFDLKSQLVHGHIINQGNTKITKEYKEHEISLGIQRCIFDEFLINRAVNYGAEIRYGEKVNNIKKGKNYFILNGYMTKKFVIASGARRMDGRIPCVQSIGYSGQIVAKLTLDNHRFHYWYYEQDNDAKYFWAFPIGVNLWNIGVWSRYNNINIKKDYNRCVDAFIKNYKNIEIRYYRKPKAEFLGHYDQRSLFDGFVNGIGDFAGNCNSQNGGGIIGAIYSAIKFADKELGREIIKVTVKRECEKKSVK